MSQLCKTDQQEEEERDEASDSLSDSSSDKNHDNGNGTLLKTLSYGALAATGAVGFVAAAPVVLTGIGFSSAGIAAGSYAAGMMSSAAAAGGGGVAAGSMVAVLQSAGAAGIGTTASAALASCGAGMGAAVGAGCHKVYSWFNSGQQMDDSKDDFKAKL